MRALAGFFLDVRKKKLKGKNSSFEKTQANFLKKLKKITKNSQIRQLPPDIVASKIFSDEKGEKTQFFSINSRPFRF